MAVIKTDFKRPERALVEELAKQHVGVVGAGLGVRQTMDHNIKPLDPTWRICGPAFTIRPDDCTDRLAAELAPKYVKDGDILVFDAGARTDAAVWGMSMTKSAKDAGAAGVVIDGATMNASLLARERPQIPIFARAISATVGRAEGPGSLNVPVICGGVIVNPGDLILGDADGVVVVPPEDAIRLSEKARAHDEQARDDAVTEMPYWERRQAEEKMRAFSSVRWEEP